MSRSTTPARTTRRTACHACLCLLGSALVASTRGARAAPGPTPTPSKPPRLPKVRMQDQDGRSLWLPQAFSGARTVLVSFFFTGCQTVCPPQTALLREAHRLLRERGHAQGLRLVALSVDPLADGPDQLRAYAQRFELPLAREGHDGWLLLTGTRGDVGQALAAFDVPEGAPGEHPSLLWVADPARARWTRSSSLNPPEALARLVQAMQT